MREQRTVTINLDFSAYLRVVREAAESMAHAFDTMAQAMRNTGRIIAWSHEVQVSGLEAKVYVRAALDPAYAEPDALDELVRLLVRKPSAVLGLGDTLMLHRADRFRLAAAAMRGWAEHRSAPVPEHSPLPYHRFLAGQRVYLHADGRLEVYS